jgi:hypothetical protein
MFARPTVCRGYPSDLKVDRVGDSSALDIKKKKKKQKREAIYEES